MCSRTNDDVEAIKQAYEEGSLVLEHSLVVPSLILPVIFQHVAKCSNSVFAITRIRIRLSLFQLVEYTYMVHLEMFTGVISSQTCSPTGLMIIALGL